MKIRNENNPPGEKLRLLRLGPSAFILRPGTMVWQNE
jgi:hypothetical protein